MAERPVDSMTLRELLNSSEHISREVEDHLTQNFLPIVEKLTKMTSTFAKPDERDQIPDVSVRNLVGQVLKSDDFSQSVEEKLLKHLKSLEQSLHKVAEG